MVEAREVVLGNIHKGENANGRLAFTQPGSDSVNPITKLDKPIFEYCKQTLLSLLYKTMTLFLGVKQKEHRMM
jgi:hypothetical protein